MCGIAGFITPQSGEPRALAAQAQRMAGTLAHRGPDGAGVWVDEDAGVALAHRRLAIVDLSAAGAQPMQDHTGRYVITLNGEIYNYEELRRALPAAAGYTWRGHSDTEVLLAAIAAWGVAGALARCVGMFAFALWDRHSRRLTLARDRFGEKPLYYGVCRGVLLFGSELKALRAHPAWGTSIDRAALDAFLRIGCVPAPQSIYAGIHKLPPASYLEIRVMEDQALTLADPVSYWSLESAAASAPAPLTPAAQLAQLEHLLKSAVAGQMVADVPVGAFLSGGIDSSLIVALMQEQSAQPVRTFSIGFSESGYNEAQHAKAVAAHLGTQHTELYVTPQQAQAVIPALPAMYDEPFADSSQIALSLVAQLARAQVTVSLSGDGADELFGGYNRHVHAAQYGAGLERIPRLLRQIGSAAIRSLPPAGWDHLLGGMLGARAPVRPGEKMHKIASSLGAHDAAHLYRLLVSQYTGPGLAIGEGVAANNLPDPAAEPAGAHWSLRGSGDLAQRMMLSDAQGYLPDDILVKVDRATMAAGLESRTPYLDHRVAGFAFGLPRAATLRHGVGKRLLRDLLYRRVPQALVDRPKQGFGVPIDTWLRGPLKQWAADLLAPARLRTEGYLDAGQVDALWQSHLSGRRDEQHALWNVLMFQSWLARQAADAAAVH